MTQTWPHCRILPCMRIKAAPLRGTASGAPRAGLSLGEARPARPRRLSGGVRNPV